MKDDVNRDNAEAIGFEYQGRNCQCECFDLSTPSWFFCHFRCDKKLICKSDEIGGRFGWKRRFTGACGFNRYHFRRVRK